MPHNNVGAHAAESARFFALVGKPVADKQVGPNADCVKCCLDRRLWRDLPLKKFPRFSEKTAFSTCQSPYLSIYQQVKNANV